MRAIWVTGLAGLLLTGCGGGEPDQQSTATTTTVAVGLREWTEQNEKDLLWFRIREEVPSEDHDAHRGGWESACLFLDAGGDWERLTAVAAEEDLNRAQAQLLARSLFAGASSLCPEHLDSLPAGE